MNCRFKSCGETLGTGFVKTIKKLWDGRHGTYVEFKPDKKYF
jgi:hypothetical protein